MHSPAPVGAGRVPAAPAPPATPALLAAPAPSPPAGEGRDGGARRRRALKQQATCCPHPNPPPLAGEGVSAVGIAGAAWIVDAQSRASTVWGVRPKHLLRPQHRPCVKHLLRPRHRPFLEHLLRPQHRLCLQHLPLPPPAGEGRDGGACRRRALKQQATCCLHPNPASGRGSQRGSDGRGGAHRIGMRAVVACETNSQGARHADFSPRRRHRLAA